MAVPGSAYQECNTLETWHIRCTLRATLRRAVIRMDSPKSFKCIQNPKVPVSTYHANRNSVVVGVSEYIHEHALVMFAIYYYSRAWLQELGQPRVEEQLVLLFSSSVHHLISDLVK